MVVEPEEAALLALIVPGSLALVQCEMVHSRAKESQHVIDTGLLASDHLDRSLVVLAIGSAHDDIGRVIDCVVPVHTGRTSSNEHGSGLVHNGLHRTLDLTILMMNIRRGNTKFNAQSLHKTGNESSVLNRIRITTKKLDAKVSRIQLDEANEVLKNAQ